MGGQGGYGGPLGGYGQDPFVGGGGRRGASNPTSPAHSLRSYLFLFPCQHTATQRCVG